MQLENHLECWKQFNYYLNLARGKQYTAEDESQFLEVKSVLAQELETILFAIECAKPTKEEIHNLLGSAPSLRSLGEINEASWRAIEKPVASDLHRLAIEPGTNQGSTAAATRPTEVILEFPLWRELAQRWPGRSRLAKSPTPRSESRRSVHRLIVS